MPAKFQIVNFNAENIMATGLIAGTITYPICAEYWNHYGTITEMLAILRPA
jgi:hypothetical protein